MSVGWLVWSEYQVEYLQSIKISSDTKNVDRNKRKAPTFKQPWMTSDLYKVAEKRSRTQPFNEYL